ncbi:MAG TPA: TraB/GumN family protein [Hyphomicrobiales bacterium]|nr:TraB/GumN family protein [Hyphomicrobiales bacterium]
MRFMQERLARRVCLCALLALTWLIPPLASAQDPYTVCADPGATMLWNVQSAELEARGATVQLFGSLHLGKAGLYPLPDPVETALRTADTLVFEIDPRSMADPALALRMQLRGLLPGGQRLEELLDSDTLLALVAVLRARNIDPANFMQYKPWMITLLLANLQAYELGFDAAWGVETYVVQHMREDAEVLELESFEQQLGMLEGLDAQVFLRYSLREFDQGAQQIDQLVRAWRCGDHATLEALLFASEQPEDATAAELAALQQLHDQLYVARNQGMAQGIDALATAGAGSHVVVVGAAHLLGEDSVVELLRGRGYTVTPVRAAP